MRPMSALFIPPDYFRELPDVFPDASRPLEIDLGCGDGTFLTGMAAHHPERDFLGVERMLGRVDKTARKIERLQLPNARIMRLESAYTVSALLPSARVSRLHLLCPDPWPKKSTRLGAWSIKATFSMASLAFLPSVENFS